MVANALCVCFIYRYLRRLQAIDILKQTSSIFQKLRLYPIVFVTLWSFPLLNRLLEIFFGKALEWARILSIFCLSLIGFSHMMLYAINPKVKELLRRKFNSLKKKNSIEEPGIDMSVIQEQHVPSLHTQNTTETDEDDGI